MKNKIVLITGASSGIGKALAEKFDREGATIAIAARRMEALESIAANFHQEGLCIKADVSQNQDCIRMVEAVIEKYGRLDVLINNAGISMRALLEATDPSVIEQVMQVNFFGTLYSTHAALPHLLAQKGSIVGVSSIAGYRGLPGRTGYSASKFAMQGFLESLRTEVMHRGVHVLVACPGFTASNIRKQALTADGSQQGQTPRKEDKMMTAEAVADHIYRAVKTRKRDIVLTSQGKITVFLNKFFPGFMDKMVFNHMKKEPDSPFE
ncbi:MAG: SDR family oxidoreductase [Bacteroidota bacterium]